MKMDKEYYTPAVEEFHVGFEYEQNYDIVLTAQELAEQESTWDTKVFEVKDYEFIEHLVKTEYVRVKHLDREDIKSLGWDYTRTQYGLVHRFTRDGGVSDMAKGTFILVFNSEKFLVTIIFEEENFGIPVDSVQRFVLFDGRLENKNELKTLMKWVQIK